jgi:hypothetical protein
VGGAKVYNTKNIISLYNTFSIKKGVGSLILEKIWRDANDMKIQYFKMWCHYSAVLFYDKYQFKYFYYSDKNKCLLCITRIFDPDMLISNLEMNEFLQLNYDGVINKHVHKNIQKYVNKNDESKVKLLFNERQLVLPKTNLEKCYSQEVI